MGWESMHRNTPRGWLAAAIGLIGTAAAVLLLTPPEAGAWWRQGDPIPHAPRLEAEIARFWRSETEQKLARCIAWNESRFRRAAVSRSGDHGVFQLSRDVWEPMFDGFANGRVYTYRWSAAVARIIYDRARRPRRGETPAQAWSSRWWPWKAVATAPSAPARRRSACAASREGFGSGRAGAVRYTAAPAGD
jgi:hypothetical protein